jgi:histidinol-phosphate aminotransferase
MNAEEKKSLISLTPYQSARDLYKTGVFMDANEHFEQWVQIDWARMPTLNRYGDSSCELLRKKLCEVYLRGFVPEEVFIGAGSNEIIDLLVKGFVEEKEAVMVVEPTYTLYETQAYIEGVRCKKVQYEADFTLPVAEMQKNSEGVKVLFLCSPNNPTGHLVSKNDIELIRAFYKGLIVIDEAYIEFAGMEKSLVSLAHTEGCVILRSFSKAWGLAAIRIGYAVASAQIIATLQKIKNSYNVSGVSQAIALQALDQVDVLWESVATANRLRQILEQQLRAASIHFFPAHANYLLIQVQNPVAVCRRLADMGIIVRDRSSLPLLTNAVRVTVGSEEENAALVRGLIEILRTS